MQQQTVCGWPTHLELEYKLCKDAEEGLWSAELAVLSEEGGHLGELLHGPGLQGLQRLDGRVTVLQEALHTQKKNTARERKKETPPL